MSAPFDTLQLARGFEAAGFPLDQASKMAEAVAQATISADLATKRDLAEMELRLTNRIDRIVGRLGALVVIVAGLLFTALHYIPPAHGETLPPEPYSCRLFADEQKKCAFGSCDRRAAQARVPARRRAALMQIDEESRAQVEVTEPEQLTLPFALPEERRLHDPVPEALVRQFLRPKGHSAACEITSASFPQKYQPSATCLARRTRSASGSSSRR